MNHGLHLAVTDILYPTKSNKTSTVGDGLVVEDVIDIVFESRQPVDSDEEVDYVQEGVDTENDIAQDSAEENEEEQEEYEITNAELQSQVKEVREIVKWFKKSALRTEVLQKIIKAKLNKSLELLLDSKTRWDSLCLMLERFLLLLPCIKEALEQLGSTKLNLVNLELLKELVHALQPVRVAVEFLSSNNINLLETDVLLEELLVQLQSQKSSIGKKLFDSVSNRVNERRLPKIASIALYLNDPSSYSKVIKSKKLTYCTKDQVMEESVKLLKRLHENTHVQLSSQESNVEEIEDNRDDDEPDTAQRFRNKVNAALKKITTEKKKEEGVVESASIKREFKAFETYGHESLNISRLKQIINSIRPTSTEVERTFSIAGKFVSKLRTRMADVAVNACVFLKSYFKRVVKK